MVARRNVCVSWCIGALCKQHAVKKQVIRIDDAHMHAQALNGMTKRQRFSRQAVSASETQQKIKPIPVTLIQTLQGYFRSQQMQKVR